MADQPEQHEKTEDPTQKRLEDAYKRGDVPKSQEVGSLFILTGGLLFLVMAAGSMAKDFTAGLSIFMEQADDIRVDSPHILTVSREAIRFIIATLLLPLGIIAVLGIGANLVQHPLVLSVDPVKPKLSKVSPLAGLKRLFSSQSLFNFAKSLVKFAIVIVVLGAVIWPRRATLDQVIAMDPVALMAFTLEISVIIMIAVLAAFAAIAGLDFAYQKFQWIQRQKMTVKEVKDEFKQTEGDPLVKGKIRQIRMERAKARMMAAVPDATVVVTNPTHFSVALKYESGIPAPLCVAKGVDEIALKIRGVATENDVPIVENPPLARALYATVDIDQEIPGEHYKAVAQVIGYVMQLNEKRRWRRRAGT
ncbi:MAG: flagellar biosynthesis protein FlhB [Pseudomonadota bacterium]